MFYKVLLLHDSQYGKYQLFLIYATLCSNQKIGNFRVFSVISCLQIVFRFAVLMACVVLYIRSDWLTMKDGISRKIPMI